MAVQQWAAPYFLQENVTPRFLGVLAWKPCEPSLASPRIDLGSRHLEESSGASHSVLDCIPDSGIISFSVSAFYEKYEPADVSA